MSHPRLSVNEICTWTVPLAEELPLWEELGIRHVGVMAAKIDAYGRDAAIAAFAKQSLTAVTVITANFDLSAPETWDRTRAAIASGVDLAAEIGGCVYFTPGRRDGWRSFDDLTDALAAAVAPSIEYAASHGARLAIEPSRRTDQSFVHTLRDGLDVCERTGLGIVADLGNCWTERDYESTLRRAGPYLAAVQICDALYGTREQSSPGGRVVPGDGDLDLAGFVTAALDADWTGPFELELVGPRIDAEGAVPATRRAVEQTSEILERVLG